MQRDARATNFVFVNDSNTHTKRRTFDWGDDFTMSRRVAMLGAAYFEFREAGRVGDGFEVIMIPLSNGRTGTQERTVWLAETMTEALQKLSHDSGDWRALMKGGLVDMYFKVITDPGFFTESITLIDAFLLGLCSIVNDCSHDRVLSNDVLSRAVDLWKSVWDSRDRIRTWPRHERAPAFQGLGVMTEPLASLLAGFHSLYWHRFSFSPSFDTYMPHVGLLLWERTKGRTELSNSASISLKALNVFNAARTPESVNAGNKFAEDAIVNGIGLEAFRLRFEQDTRRLFNPRDEAVTDMDYQNWALFHMSMRAPNVMIYLMQYDTLGICVELCNALARERCLHVGAHGLIFETVYHLSSLYIRYRCDHFEQELVLRGSTVVDIIARAMEFIARVGSGSKPMSTRIYEDFLQRICGDIQYLTSIVKQARGDPSPRGIRAAAFVAECRAHAPSQWHQMLSLFDAAILRGELIKRTHHRIRQLWVDFGTVLGLQEDRERARLVDEMRTRCARPECTTLMTHPERKLLQCKGCGQVRYCGRDCQVKHWKVHKMDCGKNLQ